MRKLTLIIAFLLVFSLTTGIASARVFFGFGIFPPIVTGPSLIAAPPPAYYPYPYGYYSPGHYGYRTWVPGYWNKLWIDHRWERVRHPGHWEYRP